MVINLHPDHTVDNPPGLDCNVLWPKATETEKQVMAICMQSSSPILLHRRGFLGMVLNMPDFGLAVAQHASYKNISFAYITVASDADVLNVGHVCLTWSPSITKEILSSGSLGRVRTSYVLDQPSS